MMQVGGTRRVFVVCGGGDCGVLVDAAVTVVSAQGIQSAVYLLSSSSSSYGSST